MSTEEIFKTTPRQLNPDVIESQTTAFCRFWNRCEREAREIFLEMAIKSDGDVIEPA